MLYVNYPEGHVKIKKHLKILNHPRFHDVTVLTFDLNIYILKDCKLVMSEHLVFCVTTVVYFTVASS